MNKFLMSLCLSSALLACSDKAMEADAGYINGESTSNNEHEPHPAHEHADTAIASTKQAASSEVARAGYLKPGADVQLIRPSGVHLALGEQRRLMYSIKSPLTEGELIFRLSSDNSTLLLESPSQQVFSLNGEAIELPIDISAAEAGMGQINFHFQLEGQSRAYSHRIPIGEQAQAAKLKVLSETATQQTLEKSQSGRVKSLRAQETIIRE